MVRDRNIAVFYTCGVCNLRCSYCGIDKNPILYKIDEALEESFKGDYYINQLKKYFPDRTQLTRIETWGGEPFLKMDRIYPLLHQVIEHYPYFSEMFSSTNFSYPTWTDQFFGLMKQFGQYPDREFHYELQLSMDGPEYINDSGRGTGTTKKCLEVFDKFIEMLPDNLPPNVNLMVFFKPTLNNNSIRQLCDKQKIIEYYQHFEKLYDKIEQLQFNNVRYSATVPNTAVPSPVTKEEGKVFAELCRLCREIEEENLEKEYFKFYRVITPYANDAPRDFVTYQCRSKGCGSGSTMMGFLPNGLISTCHEGFTNLYEGYKEYAAKSKREETGDINFAAFVEETGPIYCVTEEGYAKHEEYMGKLDINNATARLGNMVGLIIALAMAGQIDEKYIEEYEALRAAYWMQNHTSYCIKDNYNRTGSYFLVPVGMLKLLLNGAIDVIGDFALPCARNCPQCDVPVEEDKEEVKEEPKLYGQSD